eukprot:268941_1
MIHNINANYKQSNNYFTNNANIYFAPKYKNSKMVPLTRVYCHNTKERRDYQTAMDDARNKLLISNKWNINMLLNYQEAIDRIKERENKRKIESRNDSIHKNIYKNNDRNINISPPANPPQQYEDQPQRIRLRKSSYPKTNHNNTQNNQYPNYNNTQHEINYQRQDNNYN